MTHLTLSPAVVQIQQNLAYRGYGATLRTDRATARRFTGYGTYHANGRRCEPAAKHLGNGIYEVSLK